ncbi:Tripartite ATP-independent periplasmic transporters, DctQ component [Roseivivax jejudonensis]|uniref:TRAP transporter small permease protein n=1 Tax=Roseivivax jejudonensis TaxID=1529041 RepID=A0A1X6YI27_9RHOB|nr:TRAP transporter small permease [Roseivivax jejudonensis]SLN21908.1 Tripartite ATP-independent periplasmic transporters, DctQ component [Roseivivax jejudonensis]
MLSFVTGLARVMAQIGGLVLTGLVVLTCLSVLGRGLNTLGHSDALTSIAPGLAAALVGSGVGPINGDFEIVEAGVAFAIFAFLPVCQLYSAHATVDIFTQALPQRGNRWILAFWECVLTATLALIAWRLYLGMSDKMRYGETTFLLQFPIWWAYAASLAGAVAAVIIGLYCAYARLRGAVTGTTPLPGHLEADH